RRLCARRFHGIEFIRLWAQWERGSPGMRTYVICGLAFFAVMLALASVSVAQTSTGEFSGSVTDASGAIIANAKVTATSVETGAVRDGRTDQSGSFVITFLQPGNYNVSAEAPGFKK